MGSKKKKAMKLPFPFKSKDQWVSSAWPWPACGTPKTVSFRAANIDDDIFKTMNSAFVDGGAVDLVGESERFSSLPEVIEEDESEEVETVIKGVRSERLFFEPGETSSILEEAKLDDDFPFKESLVMAVDSRDPFADFRASMEEMVEAHGLKDWECLEDLLSCYLRVNGKSNHGYIVGAFVDLLVSLANADYYSPEITSSSSSSDINVEDRHQFPNCSVCSATHSFTSPLSFCSTATTNTADSPSVSLVEVDDEMEKSSSATLDNASSSSSNNIQLASVSS
ncbi:OLC1v1034111C1 [Oldenlandia corymbosa var. corymbosa]|uniref:Transcription repressor n=1 Tax=Oldenlandia corymbosa var. corymbosa TaxID=529605 RepID=A0AAV1CR39_OLDCO|nr:OLC1v1034111C1 [Oldenlandia corymbosa var. corymbosa]